MDTSNRVESRKKDVNNVCVNGILILQEGDFCNFKMTKTPCF